MHFTRTRRFCIVIAISFSFFAAELTVGFRTRSLALIADAFHYLNDLVSFSISLAAVILTKHGKAPKGFSFGWQRAEIVGAFFNGVFLAALGLSIFFQAVERFIHIQEVERPKLVLIVGAIGLVLNILSFCVLAHNHGPETESDHSNAVHQFAYDFSVNESIDKEEASSSISQVVSTVNNSYGHETD